MCDTNAILIKISILLSADEIIPEFIYRNNQTSQESISKKN